MSDTYISKLKPYLGAIAVLIGAICFSGKAVLVKMTYTYDVDFITLLALRMGLSVCFYIGLLFFLAPNKNDITKGNLLALFGLGIIGYYLSSVFDFWGLEYVSASMERLILFIYPTLVVIISALVFKTQIRKVQIGALVLTYSGMLIVFCDGNNASGDHIVIGATLIFLAALTYATYLMGTGKLLPVFGTLRYTCYVMIIAAFAVIAHYLLAKAHPLETLHQLPNEVWINSIIMAIFSTVIPSFLISEGIKMIGAGNASIIAAVGPVSTIILAYFFLGEHISLLEGIGTLFVLGGVLLVSMNSQK